MQHGESGKKTELSIVTNKMMTCRVQSW